MPMDPKVKDALVSQFLEIATDQTATTARHHLEASGWDLERALQGFFARCESSNWNSTQEEEASDQDPPHSDDDSTWSDYEDPPDYDNDHEGLDYQYPPHSPSRRRRWSDCNNLASLFAPPSDLLFKGDFEQSKDAAKLQNRWLLVNVQSDGEFNSHRLNRDTWANETVAGVIGANFILWQVNNDTDTGMKVCNYYRIHSFPVIMVIDPITGQKMKSWTGMIEATDLLDKLSEFMDSNPQDHILSLFNKRERAKAHDESKHEGEGEEKKDLEIGKEEASEKPVYPPLLEEPKCDRSLLCRVGIRLPPDGRRIQRNFLLSDPIQLLWSFCFSELNEEDRTRSFRLIQQGMPGCSKHLEYDTGLTFKESDIANSIISVRLD